MTTMFRITVAASLLAAALAAAQTPPETQKTPEPDVRLVYESDTKAYYRPCG